MLYFILPFLFIQEPDYPKKLQELNFVYQNCLDEGKFMMNCSMDFYSQMEKLMNCILVDFQENSLKEKSDLILRNQTEWETKTLPRFNRIDQRLDSVTGLYGKTPLDEVMFAYNQRALIIEERIIELIDQLK